LFVVKPPRHPEWKWLNQSCNILLKKLTGIDKFKIAMNERSINSNGFKKTDYTTAMSRPGFTLLVFIAGVTGLAGCDTKDTNGANQENISVPDVVGQNEYRASSTLVEMGFDVKTIYENNTAPISKVVDQKPNPATETSAGASIQITVSNGIPVPKLTGMTETGAEDTLVDAGFGFEPDYVDSKKNIGKVISQNIEPGELVSSGTSVVVTISNGIAVPDVVGKNKGEALQTLEEKGLKYTLARTNSFERIGQIIDQKIKPATRVDVGTKIPLTLSKGIAVPDVVGMKEASALKTLANAGLSYELNYVAGHKTKGQVVAQSIEAGSHVNSGTLIRLSISTSDEA
jgi:serine/threonine-protein kinase